MEASGRAERAPVRVLFLCTHNAGRSQMAEALLRWLAGVRVEVSWGRHRAIAGASDGGAGDG